MIISSPSHRKTHVYLAPKLRDLLYYPLLLKLLQMDKRTRFSNGE